MDKTKSALDLKAENVRLLLEQLERAYRVEQTNRDLVQANNDLKAEIELHLERASNALRAIHKMVGTVHHYMHIMQGELESLETRISAWTWLGGRSFSTLSW